MSEKKYKIVAQYEYEGIAWGNDENQAERYFLSNLNQHYTDTISFEIIQICEYCDNEDDLDDEGVCPDCAEDRKVEEE